MLALVRQGRSGEAIDEGRRALPLLLAEGDEFRLLEPLALNAALSGRPADAARVIAYADAHRGRYGAVRHPEQQRRRDRLEELLAAALPPAAREGHRAAGASLSLDAVFGTAFGDG